MADIDNTWQPPPTHLLLSSHDVHVWRANIDQPEARVQQLAQTLSADERSRAERFYFKHDHQRFIVGRGLLRKILGCYLGVAGHQLQFCYGTRGKPKLAAISGVSQLNFNLSHSQGLALYAVTRDREIGIDIEYVRQIDAVEQIVKRFFSVQENAVFCKLPLEQKQAAFFNCWTRKEAVVKAIGDGLALPLNQFDVSFLPGEEAKLLSLKGDRAVNRWCLQELKPDPNYVAAIAVEGHGWNLSCWQCPD